MNSLQMEQDQLTNRRLSFRREFSFNNEQEKHIFSKYQSLSNQLKKLSDTDLIELLLEEIQQNQKVKHQLSVNILNMKKIQEEIIDLSHELQKKRQAISLLCKSESKNINLIEKLQRRLINPLDIDNQKYYQQKYRQLQNYMSQYINNINQAQTQFTKKYNLLKNDNKRIFSQFQKANKKAIQIQKQNQILVHQLSNNQQKLNDLREECRDLLSKIQGLVQQNQILKKDNEQIRLSDRIQFRSDNHLSSEFDFIRQKINESQHLSEYQESQNRKQYLGSKTISEPMIFQLNCNQRNKYSDQKISNLEKENQTLKNEHLLYENQIKILKEQLSCAKQQIYKISLSKQQVEDELLQLTKQVQKMQQIYMREIQQSDKIKQQLNSFWMSKEIKPKCQSLHILRQNNTIKLFTDQSLNSLQYNKSNFQKTQKTQSKSENSTDQ